MDVDDVRARLGKRLKQAVGILHHQMHVEAQIGVGTQAGEHGRTEAHIRNEHAVHDVQMHHIRAGLFHHLQLVCRVGEVAGQDRRRNFHNNTP